jgi:hypothetical protein
MVMSPKLGAPEKTDEPSSRMVELVSIARGGIIYDAEVARKIGEVLLEAHYGKNELERQRPLIIEDKGAYWRVEGSWNRDQKLEGQGSFFLSVAKYDGRVLDIGMWGIVHPDPSVKALLDSYLHQQKPRNS